MIEIDRVLAKCGDFHRYQIILLLLFCVINLLSSMHYYSQTIISFVPEHWCYDQKLENYTIEEVRAIYASQKDPFCTPLQEKNGTTTGNKTCDKYIYNFDHGYISMTSELNWICGSAWKSTLGQSMFFMGSVFGTLIFGILADKYGRLPIVIVSNMVAMFGNCATIMARNVFLFSLCRLISGLATDSNFIMMYILVMEYIRPSMRTFGLNLCIGIFYCLGSVITPWIAIAVGDWKMFLFVSAIPLVSILGFYFIVPESAQWLITQRRYEDAVKCLQRVAQMNGKIVDESVFQEFQSNCTKSMVASNKTANMWHLFLTPRLRRNTLILFFKSMVITLCYDAISRNVEGLGLSPFLMFSLSATAIFPACIVLLLIQDKIGRKAMASSSLLVSGIFTSATGIIIAYQRENNRPWLLASMAIIGRFGVTVAYNSGAQYATELIPTCVRGQGVAIVHVTGYAFTFFSSYILFLSTILKPLPSLILGIISLMGAFLCLLLPETLNRILPNTLQDGENFGRGEKFFHFACFEPKKSLSTTALNESS